LEYASSSDNGTWNKSNFFKHARIDIPSIEEQETIVNKFEIIKRYEQIIISILREIKNILNREIV